MERKVITFVALTVLLAGVLGCNGEKSESPPTPISKPTEILGKKSLKMKAPAPPGQAGNVGKE
jgi:hypothetical protein